MNKLPEDLDEWPKEAIEQLIGEAL